jgi:hypothetical protein
MLKPEKGGIPWQNLSLNCPSETNGRLDRATSSFFYNHIVRYARMSDDETFEIPLQDQRVFGAGIKRKRVKFVPSSSATHAQQASITPSKSVGALYLSLVLPQDAPSADERTNLTFASAPQLASLEDATKPSASEVCKICKLPVSSDEMTISNDDVPSSSRDPEMCMSHKPRPHEASIAHQVCLIHSHPPSHLDRTRKGLAYLSSYGWDPDSRFGLGAEGQGIVFPIKAKPKDDKLGIGVVVPERVEKRKEKLERFDAGKVRKVYEKDKMRSERLREMFYMSDDVERHLRGG